MEIPLTTGNESNTVLYTQRNPRTLDWQYIYNGSHQIIVSDKRNLMALHLSCAEEILPHFILWVCNSFRFSTLGRNGIQIEIQKGAGSVCPGICGNKHSAFSLMKCFHLQCMLSFFLPLSLELFA